MRGPQRLIFPEIAFEEACGGRLGWRYALRSCLHPMELVFQVEGNREPLGDREQGRAVTRYACALD